MYSVHYISKKGRQHNIFFISLFKSSSYDTLTQKVANSFTTVATKVNES